jgi:hypothetical protein
MQIRFTNVTVEYELYSSAELQLHNIPLEENHDEIQQFTA